MYLISFFMLYIFFTGNVAANKKILLSLQDVIYIANASVVYSFFLLSAHIKASAFSRS